MFLTSQNKHQVQSVLKKRFNINGHSMDNDCDKAIYR